MEAGPPGNGARRQVHQQRSPGVPLQNGRNLERVDAHVRPVKRSESDGSLNMQILVDLSKRGVYEANCEQPCLVSVLLIEINIQFNL